MEFDNWKNHYEERRHQCKVRRVLFAVVLIAAMFLILCGVMWNENNKSQREQDKPNAYINKSEKKVASDKQGKKTEGKTTSKERQSNFNRKRAKQLYQEYTDLLVLVNKDHELSLDFDLERCSICKGSVKIAKVMSQDLEDMIKAAANAGNEYYIASGYRSREYQQSLVDKRVKEQENLGYTAEDALKEVLKLTMPAGYSEHETGLALDILAGSNYDMDESQVDTPENKWLREHSYKYGFVLRYPKEKAVITKIDYEPWHFRYVGKEAAAYLHENNLTLEEFYQLL